LKTRLQPENWSLLVKLSAVLLVPIMLALTLGGLRIADQVEHAKELAGLDRYLDLQTKSSSLLVALQRERASAAVSSSGRAGAAAATQPGSMADASRAVDDAWGELRDSTGDPGTLGAGPSDLFQQVDKVMGKLDGLRAQIGVPGRPSIPAAQVITSYTAVITPVLAFQSAVDGRLDIAALGGLSDELTELNAIREQIASEHAIIAGGLAAGALSPSDVDNVRSADVRLSAAIDEFRAGLDGDQRQQYAGFVGGPALNHFNQLKQAAISRPGGRGPGAAPPVTLPAWDDANRGVLAELKKSESGIGDEIASTSSAAQGKYRNQAGIDSVLLLLALLAAATVVFLVGRSMLRPLRVLRSTALDIAERRLPRVLEVMRAGQVPEAHVERVPVDSIEEIGQVARAFDEVHGQAIALASEQASLQVNIRNMFINLSRRSQTLVERQLQLIERLERNEQDPEQLDNLFQLDHLATRMRRNSENLLVLAGSELAKRGSAQVPVVDVLRAAASEIENYQRVVVQPPPPLAIQGRAANDIVHLVAELLDNATSYSPPDTQVVVSSSRASDGSLLVEIADRGVGMSEERLAEFNQRLAGRDDMDVSASRRMGLFVVGRLAARHGVTVRLASGGSSTGTVGVTASVTVPEELTAATKADQAGGGTSAIRRAEVEDSAPAQTNGAPNRMFAPGPNGSLPTRRPGRLPGAVGSDSRGGSARPAADGRPGPGGRPAGPARARPGGPPLNGAGPNGAGPNGAVPNGAVPNGAGPNGAGPNGAGPNGTRPKSADPLGAGPKGAAPSGAGPKGAAPLGTPPNGVAPASDQNGAASPGPSAGAAASEKPSANGVGPAAAAAGLAAAAGVAAAKSGKKPERDAPAGRDERPRDEPARDESKGPERKRDEPQRNDQQRSDQQRSDQQRSDQQRSDQQRSDQQRSDQQRSDQQRSDQQRSDTQRGDQQRDESRRDDQQRGERKPDGPRGELTSTPPIPPVAEWGIPGAAEGSAAPDEQAESSRPDSPPARPSGPARPAAQPPAAQPPVGQPPVAQPPVAQRPGAQARPPAAQPPGPRPSGPAQQPGQAPAARQVPPGQQPPPTRQIPPAGTGQSPGPRGGQPSGPGQPPGQAPAARQVPPGQQPPPARQIPPAGTGQSPGPRGGQPSGPGQAPGQAPGQPGDQPAARQGRSTLPARPDQQLPSEPNQPVGLIRPPGPPSADVPARPEQAPEQGQPAQGQPAQGQPAQGQPRQEQVPGPEAPVRPEQAPVRPEQAPRQQQAPSREAPARQDQPARPEQPLGQEQQAPRQEQAPGQEGPPRRERAPRPEQGQELPARQEPPLGHEQPARQDQLRQGPRVGQGPARGPAGPGNPPPAERSALPPRLRSTAERRSARGQAPDESPIFEETSAWFRDNWMVGPTGSADVAPPARRERRSAGPDSEATEAVPAVDPESRTPVWGSESAAPSRPSRSRTGLPGQVTRANAVPDSPAEETAAVEEVAASTASAESEGDRRPGWTEQEVPLRPMEQPDAGELTAAGLPKRKPRAQLIPDVPSGSEQSHSGAPAARSADQVRGRLSSYQSGIRQGREIRARRTSEPASASGDGNTKENA
jgi:signal transduction histidine kinase